MDAATRCGGTTRLASKRSAGIAGIVLALAVPQLAAAADVQVATVAPAAAGAVVPAAPQPAAGPRVSFTFLTAPAPAAAPPEPRHRSGIAGLADRVQATAARINDPHAQQHWGYAHGQVMFSFKTGGR